MRLAAMVFSFAAFALAAWAVNTDDAARGALAGWFAVLLGTALVLHSAVGLQSGEARLGSKTVRREKRPAFFAAGIAVLVVPGVLLTIGGVYWLLTGAG